MIDSKVGIDSISNTFPKKTGDISSDSSKKDKLCIVRINLMSIFEELLIREDEPDSNKNNNRNDHPMVVFLFSEMTAIIDCCYF